MSTIWSMVGGNMNGISWEALKEARRQAHYAVQWLAKAARNYIPKEPDESHTSLTWDTPHEALMLQPVTSGSIPFRMGLRLKDLALIVVTDHDITPVPLLGHTDRQVEAWVSASMMEQFVDRDLAINFPRLPYALPPHPIAEGARYGDGLEDGALDALAGWLAQANTLLNNVRKTEDSSPVRCWPHHLDIATLIVLDDSDGEDARTIGVGLSPGDETYDAPYLYVTPWPYPDEGTLPTLETGKWHIDGFTAAVLNGPAMTDGADTQAFVTQAVTACQKILLKNLTD